MSVEALLKEARAARAREARVGEAQARQAEAQAKRLEAEAERAELKLQRDRINPGELVKRIVSAFNLKWATRDDEARVIDHVEEILRGELGLEGGAE